MPNTDPPAPGPGPSPVVPLANRPPDVDAEVGARWVDPRGVDARLEVLERFATIGRVTGAVAHDLNNLVTAIAGYATLLGESLPDGDGRRTDVAGILTAADRCEHLVRQLLDAGRPGDGQVRPVDLGGVVRGQVDLLRRVVNGRARLSCHVASAEPLVAEVDPARFEQVLLNLVVNARDALAEGAGTGRLDVRLRAGGTLRRDDRARGDGAPLADAVVLEVSDDGVGMTDAVAAAVFEPFFTTKTDGRGTGLGLSSVRATVESWGGAVRLDTAPGRGTTVSVVLPRAQGGLGTG